MKKMVMSSFRTQMLRVLSAVGVNVLGVLFVFLIVRYLRESGRGADALFLSNAFLLVTLQLLIGTLKVEYHQKVRQLSEGSVFRVYFFCALLSAAGLSILLGAIIYCMEFDDFEFFALMPLALFMFPVLYVSMVRQERFLLANLLRAAPIPIAWAAAELTGLGLISVFLCLAAMFSLLAGVWMGFLQRGQQDSLKSGEIFRALYEVRTKPLIDLVNFAAVNFPFFALQLAGQGDDALTFFEYSRVLLAPLNLALFPLSQRVSALFIGQNDHHGTQLLERRAFSLILVAAFCYLLVAGLGYSLVSADWVQSRVAIFTEYSALLFALVGILLVPRAMTGALFPILFASDWTSLQVLVLSALKLLLFSVVGLLLVQDLIVFLSSLAVVEIVFVVLVGRLFGKTGEGK